jgi:hypothetical protein
MPSNSWWLHGPIIAKQVLFDSIDVALHGQITGNITDLLQFALNNPTYLRVDQASMALNYLGGGSIRPVGHLGSQSVMSF